VYVTSAILSATFMVPARRDRRANQKEPPVHIVTVTEVAMLLVATAAAVPVLAIVLLALSIPFMQAERRAEAHRCLDKLTRFAIKDRSRVTRLLTTFGKRESGSPP
jgi:hypothetical protein